MERMLRLPPDVACPSGYCTLASCPNWILALSQLKPADYLSTWVPGKYSISKYVQFAAEMLCASYSNPTHWAKFPTNTQL